MTYSDAFRAEVQNNPNSQWHGKVSGYTLIGCRCSKCRDAQALYMRQYRSVRKGAEV